jgi:pyruvate dehydrogenase E1 component alpha subunit
MGMQMPEEVKILPINVPIASQFQHATGLAYASKYRDEDDVTIAYVGDGGTSQGDFHEALNFAAVNQTPNVFIIQNNQFAISTRRKKQTAVNNLAQKALAYGMPGIQVDGNDALAMYAVTKEAIDRARAGDGPTLIEAYTYRMGAHTTSDDPSIYRNDEEVEEWKGKDPISRMFKYLKSKELWDEEKDEAFKKEKQDFVKDTFKEVENSGLVPIEEVFGHIYETMPSGLKEQMEKRNKEAK